MTTNHHRTFFYFSDLTALTTALTSAFAVPNCWTGSAFILSFFYSCGYSAACCLSIRFASFICLIVFCHLVYPECFYCLRTCNELNTLVWHLEFNSSHFSFHHSQSNYLVMRSTPWFSSEKYSFTVEISPLKCTYVCAVPHSPSTSLRLTE